MAAFFGKRSKQFARHGSTHTHPYTHTVNTRQFANVAVYVQHSTPATKKLNKQESARERELRQTDLEKQSANGTVAPGHKECNIKMHNWARGRGKVYEQ